MNECVSARRMLLWIASAMSAPLAIHAGKASWEYTLIVGLACTLFVMMVLRFGDVGNNRIVKLLQIAALGIVSGTFGRDISACWGETNLSMPLVLIVLAVLSADTADKAGRVCCVVAWVIAILYIIVLSAGVKNIRLDRLAPNGMGNEMLITVFLLPSVWLMLPSVRNRGHWLMLIVLFAVVISVSCMGTLSPSGVKSAEIPIFEYSKSLNLRGIAERFEAVTSVAVTLGMFCLLSFLLSAAESMMKNGALLGGAIAAGNVLILPVNPVLISVVMWVIVPLAMGMKNNRKNMKKVLDKWGGG